MLDNIEKRNLESKAERGQHYHNNNLSHWENERLKNISDEYNKANRVPSRITQFDIDLSNAIRIFIAIVAGIVIIYFIGMTIWFYIGKALGQHKDIRYINQIPKNEYVAINNHRIPLYSNADTNSKIVGWIHPGIPKDSLKTALSLNSVSFDSKFLYIKDFPPGFLFMINKHPTTGYVYKAKIKYSLGISRTLRKKTISEMDRRDRE